MIIIYKCQLDKLQEHLVIPDANNKLSEGCSLLQSQIDNLKTRNISKKGNFATILKLEKDVNIMLAAYIGDRLVKGLVGKVMGFKFFNRDVGSVQIYSEYMGSVWICTL